MLTHTSEHIHITRTHTTYTHTTHMHTHTHTHTQNKAYSNHVKHSYCRLVKQHWDIHLCTTEAFQPYAGKSSWGRASNQQEDCPSLTDRGR